MTTVAPLGPVAATSLPPAQVASVGAGSAARNGLPPPLLAGADPTDALGMMLAAVERMSSDSLNATEDRIRRNHQKLDKAVDKFLDQIAEALGGRQTRRASAS